MILKCTKSCKQKTYKQFCLVMQKYQDDLADLPDNNGGLQATLYSILTVALVVSGAAYLVQPQV